MSRNQRLSLLGLAVVVLVVAFVVARSGGGDSGDSGTTSTTSTGGGQPKSDVVVVKNAKPVGGVQHLTYKKGGTKFTGVKSRIIRDVDHEKKIGEWNKLEPYKAKGFIADWCGDREL